MAAGRSAPQLIQRFEVATPPDRVWGVMSDVVKWPEWTASVTSVRLLDGGPLRIGSRAWIKQPSLPPARWKVTVLEPGRGFEWESVGPLLRVTGIHTVEPAPGGSRVTLALAYDGPIGRLVGRLTRGISERYVTLEGEGLRARSEGRR